ncbi:MAG: hypothetical protein Q8880_09675 [Bacteroidota bacterium]|nr:hypothetical protein [Bacteroidota bacterium]
MKTNTTSLILIFIVFGIFFTCCSGGYTSWEKNKTVRNIEFDKLRYSVKGKDTTTIIGYLKHDIEYKQYPCSKGWIHFSKDWKLKLFCLSRDFEINSNCFKKGTWIRYNDKEDLICVFPEQTLIQGHLCRGGGGPKGITTSFYPNGRLKSFYPPEDIEINNILCKSSCIGPVYLKEDGSLLECTLSQDVNFNGVTYSKNTRLNIEKLKAKI